LILNNPTLLRTLGMTGAEALQKTLLRINSRGCLTNTIQTVQPCHLVG
jgi:hypothetical protein